MTEIVPFTDAIDAIVNVDSTPHAPNPARVYLASLGSDSGRRTMAQALDKIARLVSDDRMDLDTLPWYALRFQHVAAIRARLMETGKQDGTSCSPATANKALSALRGTLRAAWRLGQMSADDYQAAADVKGVRGQTIPAGRELSHGELGALMAACANDPTPAGARDAAIIAVLYAAGLRRAEIVALDREDYNAETGELRVAGKGNKERLCWVNQGAAAALGDWLLLRDGIPCRGGDMECRPGPLFWRINKGRRLIPERLTPQAIYNLLEKRARGAQVADFSPHDLRRTFVSDLLDAGADIATVQKMAGHANVTTTARYDRRPEEAKKKAADLLHVPYRKRGLG